ncbi:hypothetical protein CAPTEDRAFT_213637 [Capitella teleta]|uniref:G-protein coupled receptors family 1 profile domain-containing protein n=1 Tax=Capitella teleta TaxID=283909 RepID=R7VC35_CAPTE|nr:hypothetical protein CAPTEDRAFT_213637 [Capitella teleta]|eukprot:ELU16413.1 hypothetical protein CAPTEDRAFT_213637 [Capitella teleta]
MKIRNAVIMVVCQWAWSILMVIPASIYKRIQEDHLKYIVMTPEAYPKGYTLYITTPLGFILLIANALLYARVFWLLKVQTNKVSNNTHQAISNRRSRRLTRMLLIVVCVLVGCWTPVTVLSSMAVTEGGLFVLNAYITYAISFAVVMIPSFMNNIIYAWQHQDYRRAYLQLIRWNPQSDTD